MERYFSDFQVEIVDEQFIHKDIKTERSALVSLFNAQNELLEKITFGFIEINKIFEQIDNQEPINLSNCYIEGFSLSLYRQNRNLDVNKKISLRSINCENSFFCSGPEKNTSIDFSYASISSDLINFKNSIFAGASCVSFDYSIIRGNLFFDYSLFNFVDVSFSNIRFTGETVSFKNAVFKDGLKRFENNRFDCKEILFVNSEFGNGDVIFSESQFTETEIDFKISRFGNGRVDFNKVNFGTGLVNFEKAEFGDGNVNFRSSSFSGNVEFPRCVFGNGDLSFIGTNFEKGEVSFAGTEFGKGKLTFKQTFFGGDKLDFHYSHFEEGDILFERTDILKANVDFRAVDFGSGKVSFNRVNFGSGEVSFEASELKKGRITFKKTVFGAGVFNFEMADFKNAELIIDDVDFGSGKVSFRKSKFGLLSLESSQLNNYFDLRVEECGKLDLSNTIIKDIIDIDSSDFKTNIKALDLSGIRLLGRIYLDWRQNNVKQLIHQQDTNYANKAAQFRVLKQNYNLNGQYEYEDEAYVEFKRSESKSILENSKNKKWTERIRAKISYFLQLLIFDKVGQYATNPIRVLLSMTVVFVTFSFIYFFFSLLTNDSTIHSSLFKIGDPRNLSTIEKSFYHSAVTFLTIGYGDYYPAGYLRAVSGIEGFTGLFLMSYFTVAFVRKILR
jgi:hypothetical protein